MDTDALEAATRTVLSQLGLSIEEACRQCEDQTRLWKLVEGLVRAAIIRYLRSEASSIPLLNDPDHGLTETPNALYLGSLIDRLDQAAEEEGSERC